VLSASSGLSPHGDLTQKNVIRIVTAVKILYLTMSAFICGAFNVAQTSYFSSCIALRSSCEPGILFPPPPRVPMRQDSWTRHRLVPRLLPTQRRDAKHRHPCPKRESNSRSIVQALGHWVSSSSSDYVTPNERS
jgi:hypothetical protein